MQLQLVFATVLLALADFSQRVDAYAKYIKLLPNGANVPDASNIGHPDAAGMEGVNDFGKAFKKAGNAWTKELCMADTDGDGFTNGQELGDPCCTWTPTSTASLITDGVSHPSDKTKTPSNAELIAGCSTSGTSGTSGAATSGNSTSSGGKETINDVLAPVSATSAPAGAGKPADDDEDDSSESAVVSSGISGTSASTVASAVVLVCMSALVAAF